VSSAMPPTSMRWVKLSSGHGMSDVCGKAQRGKGKNAPCAGSGIWTEIC
jgi:hypothetical protein